jgi:hypothetical protein
MVWEIVAVDPGDLACPTAIPAQANNRNEAQALWTDVPTIGPAAADRTFATEFIPMKTSDEKAPSPAPGELH